MTMKLISDLLFLLPLLLIGGKCLGADQSTIFTKTFATSIPELQSQRATQKRQILETINRADTGQALDRFGMEVNGARLGLFLLEPDTVTTSSIHAVVVLRNVSTNSIIYYGNESDVLRLFAIGEPPQLLQRTAKGETYGGNPPVLPLIGRSGRTTIPAGGQVVYEINLAEFFNVPPGKSVLFHAMANLRAANFRVEREIRSENTMVVPKAKADKTSVFDGPHIPPEHLKFATNRPIGNEPPQNPADAIKTRLPHPRSQPPSVADPVKTAPSREEVGKARSATNKVTEPAPPAGQDHVDNPAGSSQTKYYLAGIVLSLLAIGGFLLKRR